MEVIAIRKIKKIEINKVTTKKATFSCQQRDQRQDQRKVITNNKIKNVKSY